MIISIDYSYTEDSKDNKIRKMVSIYKFSLLEFDKNLLNAWKRTGFSTRSLLSGG